MGNETFYWDGLNNSRLILYLAIHKTVSRKQLRTPAVIYVVFNTPFVTKAVCWDLWAL